MDNAQWEIIDLSPMDDYSLALGDWVMEIFRKRRSQTATHNNWRDDHDKIGFLGEVAYLAWLRQQANVEKQNNITWSGWEQKKFGDEWDFKIDVPTTIEAKGFLTVDVKTRTLRNDNKFYMKDMDIYIGEGENKAKQIEKNVDIFMWVGMYHDKLWVPYLLGWEWKDVIVNSWKVVLPGESLFSNTDAVKAKTKQWVTNLMQLRKTADATKLFDLT